MYEKSAGLSPAVRELEVHAAMVRLRSANADLREGLESLSARLQGVLSPPPPTDANCKGNSPYLSEFAQSISNQADCTYFASSVIADMLARLEI